MSVNEDAWQYLEIVTAKFNEALAVVAGMDEEEWTEERARTHLYEQSRPLFKQHDASPLWTTAEVAQLHEFGRWVFADPRYAESFKQHGIATVYEAWKQAEGDRDYTLALLESDGFLRSVTVTPFPLFPLDGRRRS